MSFPRYPKYKASGVEWLGEVPEHWKVVSLRYLVDCLDGVRVPLNAEERARAMALVLAKRGQAADGAGRPH